MNKFVVVILPNEAKANEAADVLHGLHRDGSLTLYGLAIAHKADEGDVTVVERQGEGLPGAGVGALAGALVGLIGGPVTALLGAAGGAWIGSWRDVEHLGISAEFVEEVSNALAPGATALVADVAEDRVAFVDEQMARLGGVVLREWQSELPEMKLATEAAARRTEIEHLVAERRDATPKRQAVIDAHIDKAKARLLRTAEQASARLDEIDASTDARLEALRRQLDTAGASARDAIERRIDETRRWHDRRAALLNQTLRIVEEARV